MLDNNCGICFDEFKNLVQDSNDSYPLRIQPGFTNIFGGKIMNDLACHKCNDNFVIPFRLGEPSNPREIAIYVMKCEELIDDEISKLRNKINELEMLKEKY